MDRSGSDQPTKSTINLPVSSGAATGHPTFSGATTSLSPPIDGAAILPTPSGVETTTLVSSTVSGKPDSRSLGSDVRRRAPDWRAAGIVAGYGQALRVACEGSGIV